MKKLITKTFGRWAKKKLTNDQLLSAVENLVQSKSAESLGSNLWKLRVSREGEGKSGGYRTIVVYKKRDRAIFIYGFGKNEADNISKSELEDFKIASKAFSSLNRKDLERLIDDKELLDLEVGK